MQKQLVEFTINGQHWSGMVHPMQRLLDTIRENVGLKGTKEGCGEGECGACTVLLDDLPVASCMIPTCQAHGHQITTIEGLANHAATAQENEQNHQKDAKLHQMQEAFLTRGGAQCGICTPGMILSAVAYQNNPALAESWPQALAGNLCRCTGYTKILDSCLHAQKSDASKPDDHKHISAGGHA